MIAAISSVAVVLAVWIAVGLLACRGFGKVADLMEGR